MNVDSNIYELKGQKEKLEFQLYEEQLFLESVPQRKKWAKNAITMYFSLICSFICGAGHSINLIWKNVLLMQETSELSFDAVDGLMEFIILFISIIAIIKLWTSYIEYVKQLHGRHPNIEAFGALNFKEDEQASKDKIEYLKKDIATLEKSIKEYENLRSYNHPKIDAISLLKNTDSEDEEFFRYARGNWNIDKVQIDADIQSGKYNRELSELKSDLSYHMTLINNLIHKKEIINQEYNENVNTLIMLFIPFMIFILGSFMSSNNSKVQLTFIILGVLYIITTLIVFMKKILPKIMIYKVEHQYNKYVNYADTHDIIPTFIEKSNIYKKIDDLNRKKDFYERVEHYRKRHIDQFENMAL